MPQTKQNSSETGHKKSDDLGTSNHYISFFLSKSLNTATLLRNGLLVLLPSLLEGILEQVGIWYTLA